MPKMEVGDRRSVVVHHHGITCRISTALSLEDEKKLATFFSTSPAPSYMQTIYWPHLIGESRFRRFGFLWCETDGEIRMASVVRFTTLLPGRYLASLRRGPVTHSLDDLDACLPAVRAGLRMFGVCTAVANPGWREELADAASAILTKHGYRITSGITASATGIVSLEPSEDEILAGFESRCRRDIRVAARKGLIVRPAENENEAAAFESLFEEFAIAKNFDRSGVPNMVEQWRYINDNHGAFLLAFLNEQLVGGSVVHRVADIGFIVTVATRPVVPDIPRAHSLVWEAMREMKRQGCRIADHVGMSSEDSLDEGSWRRDLFKKAFRMRRVRLVPTHQVAVRPLCHNLLSPLRQMNSSSPIRRFLSALLNLFRRRLIRGS